MLLVFNPNSVCKRLLKGLLVLVAVAEIAVGIQQNNIDKPSKT